MFYNLGTWLCLFPNYKCSQYTSRLAFKSYKPILLLVSKVTNTVLFLIKHMLNDFHTFVQFL